MTEQTTYLEGLLLDEETRCTLTDLCRLCGVAADLVQEMIDEGIISPEGAASCDWRFTLIEIRRVRTAVRLQQDLRINLPGCALALDLLEELETLRLQVGRR